MASAPGTDTLFTDPLIFLSAAVIAVPIFKRLGLGSVLGYLAAGVVIGPVSGLITDGQEILHVAELGVVLLLFIIGLELKPARLWAMKHDIFGLGSAQILLCGAALTGIVMALGQRFEAALTIGLALALSSTAIAMQILQERDELRRSYGQKSFSILLMQDMAIVPLLALTTLLAQMANGGGEAAGLGSIALEIGIIVGAVAALILAGKYLLNPLFSLFATARAQEIMTAAALLVVLGAAALMDAAGMSSAMGAFLAGVMLAESSFRHELEADIEPFRGLLMGLFFMAVGMALDLDVIAAQWPSILGLALAFMTLKGTIIYGLGRLWRMTHRNAFRMAMLLPQHGEFAFVVFTTATGAGLLGLADASFYTAIATVTMALTPLTVVAAPRILGAEKPEEIAEDFSDATGNVLLISFGRFGQLLSQMLLAEGVDVTIIDNNAQRIRSAAKFGFKVYFGDGRRLDVLRAAGLDRAKMVIVCTGYSHSTSQIVDLIQKHAPHTQILVRSYDRAHAIELRQKKVDYELRESVESAFRLGAEALRRLDVQEDRVVEISSDVRARDDRRLDLQVDGDISSGQDHLHTNTPTPEPLRAPIQKARPMSEETEEIVEQSGTEIQVEKDPI